MTPTLGGRLYAVLYDALLWPFERLAFRSMRRRLLAGAHGDVIEVGAGTGLNLALYSRSRVRAVWAVEPDAAMLARARARAARHGVQAYLVPAPGEALPFADESYDTAVLTLVLCSVADPEAVLRELDRVLRPQGELLVLEHVRSHRPLWRRAQARLAPTWRRIAAGCRLDQDPEPAIASLFDITERRYRDGLVPLLTLAARRRPRA